MRVLVLVLLLSVAVPVSADASPRTGACVDHAQGLTLRAAAEGDPTTPSISVAAEDLLGPVVLLAVWEAPAAYAVIVEDHERTSRYEDRGSSGGVGLGDGIGCLVISDDVHVIEATMTFAGVTHAHLEIWSA